MIGLGCVDDNMHCAHRLQQARCPAGPELPVELGVIVNGALHVSIRPIGKETPSSVQLCCRAGVGANLSGPYEWAGVRIYTLLSCTTARTPGG